MSLSYELATMARRDGPKWPAVTTGPAELARVRDAYDGALRQRHRAAGGRGEGATLARGERQPQPVPGRKRVVQRQRAERRPRDVAGDHRRAARRRRDAPR